jgi:chromosome partitioning protein
MKTVALLSRKGGAGKTTCAIHMGVLAQASGQRVLFLDLDPQGSLSAWWHSREAETPGLVQSDAGRLPDLLRAATQEGYDLAVIDTPPAVTFDTARTAAMADLALIPLRPSVLDIYAVASTADVVKASKKPGLLVLNACLPSTRGNQEASSTIEARKALTGAALPLATASITQRIDYTRALNGGEAVSEFAPASKAAQEMQMLWQEVQRRLS